MNSVDISVLILTLNEELDLPECLKSVSWSDDVVVFDSFSTDHTVKIAKESCARVFQRKFDNYAAQRNAALSEVQYKYPWVLLVDADERWPESLCSEMIEAIRADGKISLFHFRRKDMFMGKWLRRSTGYPTWTGRLLRPDSVRVEREINEEYHTDEEVGYLNGHFIHYPFNKGVANWFDRHNRYSSMEAISLAREVGEKLRLLNLISQNPIVRRKAMKQLAYRLPFRPIIVFFYLYFFRLGFLDGVPGLIYCRLRAIYEYMIDLKVKESRRRENNLPV